MDAVELRLLLVARGLLDRAEAANDGTGPGVMAAVVLYDTAVETGAKTAWRTLPPGSRTPPSRALKEPYMPAVLQELKNAAGDDAVEIIEARRLHDLRNMVQHDGLVPPADATIRARLQARDFLQWACLNFFKQDFWSLSRASLVRDEQIRGRLETAVAFAANGVFDLAAEALAVAFELALDELRAGERHSWHHYTTHDIREIVQAVGRASGSSYGNAERAAEKVLRAFDEKIQTLEDRVEAVALGARASEYVWFRRRFPRVQLRYRDEPYIESVGQPPTPEEFTRAFDFVTTTVLHWQEFPEPPPPPDDPYSFYGGATPGQPEPPNHAEGAPAQ